MNTNFDLHFVISFDDPHVVVMALTDRGRAFLGCRAVEWHPPLYAAALDAGLRVSFESQEVMQKVTNA